MRLLAALLLLAPAAAWVGAAQAAIERSGVRHTKESPWPSKI